MASRGLRLSNILQDPLRDQLSGTYRIPPKSLVGLSTLTQRT